MTHLKLPRSWVGDSTAPPEPQTAPEQAELASAENIGMVLLTEHAFTLQIIGVLLLAATIGAVLLAKKRFV